MTDLLTVTDLSIGYKRPLQKGLCFSVSEGEVLFIKGRNGAGKSTLIKTLCGDIEPLSGNIDWGINSKNVAILPQLVAHEFALSITLGEILEAFELSEDVYSLIPEELKLRRFNDASGGEKQKTLILSRLGKGRSFLILDEPFNHMDSTAINEVLKFLSELLEKKILKGLVLISHIDAAMSNQKIKEVQLS